MIGRSLVGATLLGLCAVAVMASPVSAATGDTTITSPDGGAKATFQGSGNKFYVKDLKHDGHTVYGQWRNASYTSPLLYVMSDKANDYITHQLTGAPKAIRVCTVYAWAFDSCTAWTSIR